MASIPLAHTPLSTGHRHRRLAQVVAWFILCAALSALSRRGAAAPGAPRARPRGDCMAGKWNHLSEMVCTVRVPTRHEQLIHFSKPYINGKRSVSVSQHSNGVSVWYIFTRAHSVPKLRCVHSRERHRRTPARGGRLLRGDGAPDRLLACDGLRFGRRQNLSWWTLAAHI